MSILNQKLRMNPIHLIYWTLGVLAVFLILTYIIGSFVDLPFKIGTIIFLLIIIFMMYIVAKLLFLNFVLERKYLLPFLVVLAILGILLYFLIPYADIGELFSMTPIR